MFQELNKLLNESGDRLHAHLVGMPRVSQKQDDINPFKNFEYRSKVFFIAEEDSAAEFAEFMTKILHNPNLYHIIREKENWTQNGECIRIIDYLEKSRGED